MKQRAEIATDNRCPLCHDLFGPLEPGLLVCCGSCHTPYHRICYQELGGCGTLGCTGKGKRRQRIEVPPAAPEPAHRPRRPTIEKEQRRRELEERSLEQLTEPFHAMRPGLGAGEPLISSGVLVIALLGIIALCFLYSLDIDALVDPYERTGIEQR